MNNFLDLTSDQSEYLNRLSNNSEASDIIPFEENISNFAGDISFEDVSSSTWQEVPKYRSIEIMQPTTLGFDRPASMAPPTLQRPTLSRKPTDSKVSTSAKTNIQIVSSNVPELPSFLMPTHFVCGLPLGKITSQIDCLLNGLHDISFKYDPSEFKWDCFQIRGSNCCQFVIHIYSGCSGLTVEANRLSGDAKAFHLIFQQMKQIFVPSRESEPKLEIFPNPCVLDDYVSETQANECIRNIVRLATASTVESQLEASRMLCDLSSLDGVRDYLSYSNCIPTLATLVCNKEEAIRRNAMLALTNLSESQFCHDDIINAGVISEILGMVVVDGPFYTLETRRAGARLLANVSSKLAPKVVQQVGSGKLVNWISSVDSISDEKIRIHADRARASLRPILI